MSSRYGTSRFAHALLALGTASLCGYGVTTAELKALNPGAATLEVSCHPWQILESVKTFAVRPSTGDIVTDETQAALRDFAPYAGAFIAVNKSAPPENTQIMASHDGLICQKDMVVRSTPLESLRQREPCVVAGNAVQGQII